MVHGRDSILVFTALIPQEEKRVSKLSDPYDGARKSRRSDTGVPTSVV